MPNMREKLQNLPQKPGVYLFKDREGEVLYVGKAKNLKNRIRTYFNKNQNHLPRTDLMLKEVTDFDYIIVSSETESLILENNLIKQYRPRFNVKLRDDKNYQFIKIDYGSEIPQIYPVRRIAPPPSLPHEWGGIKGGGKYFGPYTQASSVRQTLKLIKRTFRICSSRKVSSKPCFHYHLGMCEGVCIGKISLREYRLHMTAVEDFLNHKQGQILKELKAQMLEASSQKQFEKAANFRDKLQALRRIWEKQKIVFTQRLSQDYLSLVRSEGRAIVNLFVIREGKLIHQEIFELVHEKDISEAESLEAFIKQYYTEASDIPKEIVVKDKLTDQKLIENWLGLKILIVQKGKKRKLLELGEENAKDYMEKTYASYEEILVKLRNLLNLPVFPRRIETYDISNIQGFLPVGSMIIFSAQGGGFGPKKSDYRKFKINLKSAAGGPDDYAMMKEMLTRRFAHSQIGSKSQILNSKSQTNLKSKILNLKSDKWPLPDLIVIDGGKGQLNAALEVLETYNLKLPSIGLAKKLEEIYLPKRKNPLRLPADSPVLHLLERMRDEAHRFAITFYRARHLKEQARSKLDEIPGIGPKTRKKLLQKFGTISGIKKASLEILAQGLGIKTAKKIKEYI